MWVKGKHTFSFGGEYRALQDKERNEGNESGSYSYSSLNTGLRGVESGNDLPVFCWVMSPQANLYVPTLATQYIRQKYIASYINDSWKVLPKLTLNLGVRWDISTPTREKYDNFSFIDPYLQIRARVNCRDPSCLLAMWRARGILPVLGSLIRTEPIRKNLPLESDLLMQSLRKLSCGADTAFSSNR